jgi:hypothetical protein
MDDYIKAEWTHWMKELAADRKVPGWFKKNLTNIHDTMSPGALSPADYAEVVQAAMGAKVISGVKAREMLGVDPTEAIKRDLKRAADKAVVETGYVSMLDEL